MRQLRLTEGVYENKIISSSISITTDMMGLQYCLFNFDKAFKSVFHEIFFNLFFFESQGIKLIL